MDARAFSIPGLQRRSKESFFRVIYRYPLAKLAPDYLRAAVGLAVVGLPLATMEVPGVVRIVLACLMVLFAAFALQNLFQHLCRVEMTETTLVMHPLGTRIDWKALTRLRLAWFTVRRGGSKGWMELKLRAGRSRVRIDSRLEGFDEIAHRAVAAARDRDLDLDPVTLANMRTLGLAPESAPQPGREGG